MPDLTLPTDVMLCPWDTLGRPRTYVDRKTWAFLLTLLPFTPTTEPTALIVDQGGWGPHYVVRGEPVLITHDGSNRSIEWAERWLPTPAHGDARKDKGLELEI